MDKSYSKNDLVKAVSENSQKENSSVRGIEDTHVVSSSPSIKVIAKEWAEFKPQVPLSFILASKKAARLKNAY